MSWSAQWHQWHGHGFRVGQGHVVLAARSPNQGGHIRVTGSNDTQATSSKPEARGPPAAADSQPDSESVAVTGPLARRVLT